MAKYIIEEETLQGLANALRSVTGEIRYYTPVEMIEAVTNIMKTGTYIIVDEEGNEVPAVFVENETVFTATANDIRAGMTAVTESGVTEGTKEIPPYYVSEGLRMVPMNSKFILPHTDYDYTKMQALLCVFNTNTIDSVSTDKVAINNSVYAVSSALALSSVTKDSVNKRIDFGLTNDTGKKYIIRYFMFKEIY